MQVVAGDRSRLLKVLAGIFTPVLSPLRRILPQWRIDPATVILAVLMQLVAFALKAGYR